MIQAIKKVKDSITLVFSPTNLPNLMNYGYDKKGWPKLVSKYIKYSEPEKTTGPSGLVPSM